MELHPVDLSIQAFGAQVGKLIALVVVGYAVMSLWDLAKVLLTKPRAVDLGTPALKPTAKRQDGSVTTIAANVPLKSSEQ